MKTAVVTGGAGFLGSHLTDRLLAEGYRVVGVDNFITGNPANLDHLKNNPNYSFQKQDVSNHFEVPGEVNFVFHFASPASPIDYLELPIQTLKVGSLGTHNALGLAKAKGAEYGVLLVRAEVHKERAAECERASYGFTHADVSAVLMTIWKCPQPLVESVRYHHQPEAAGDAKMIAACVCVGNFLAHMNGDPLTSDGKPDANLIYSKALLGLTNEQIASFSDLMGENWDFVKALLRA